MSRWHTTEFDLLPEHAFQPRGWKGSMTLEGGGKGGSAPAPDPRMAEASLRQVALNEAQFKNYQEVEQPWMRSVAAEALGISRANADRANALSDYQLANMKFNDQRYKDVAIPFEDQLLKDVNRFDSQGYKDQQVASAKADVQSAFDNAQAQSQRGLQRRGVNPASGMALATQGANDIGKATAMATAANKTRMAADQIGLSSKMSMYGGMKGLAGLGNANASLAMGSMGTSNASGAGMTGAAGSYLGANNAALAGYNSGMGSGLSSLGSYSKLGIDAASANMANDPTNAILGAATGVGMAYATGGMSEMGKMAARGKATG